MKLKGFISLGPRSRTVCWTRYKNEFVLKIKLIVVLDLVLCVWLFLIIFRIKTMWTLKIVIFLVVCLTELAAQISVADTSAAVRK